MAVRTVIIPVRASLLRHQVLAEKSTDSKVNKKDKAPAPESVLPNRRENERQTAAQQEEEKGTKEGVGHKCPG